MNIDELEALLEEHFAEDRWEEFVAGQRLDPEACGIFCGRLAKRALETSGLTPEDDELWMRLGPQFTTVALAAFEAALRLKEEREAVRV